MHGGNVTILSYLHGYIVVISNRSTPVFHFCHFRLNFSEATVLNMLEVGSAVLSSTFQQLSDSYLEHKLYVVLNFKLYVVWYRTSIDSATSQFSLTSMSLQHMPTSDEKRSCPSVIQLMYRSLCVSVTVCQMCGLC